MDSREQNRGGMSSFGKHRGTKTEVPESEETENRTTRKMARNASKFNELICLCYATNWFDVLRQNVPSIGSGSDTTRHRKYKELNSC